MELHRTDTMVSPTGQLIDVRTIGVLPHVGDTRELVLGLKFGNNTQNARRLSCVVVEALEAVGVDDATVTWAPTTDLHRRERGIDHAELIARHVAAHCSWPWRRLLRRIGVDSQTGLSKLDRERGPRFVARRASELGPIVVVDDVVTTGATFRAAATALVEAGATEVVCVAPSRTMLL